MDRDQVVIVGAGQAGAWVAITLRSLDPDRRIVLVGNEAHPPYERPPLSKGVLQGKAEIASAYIKPLEFYPANGIDLRLNASVAKIDREAHEIIFGDGTRLSYGTLVLATGSRPRLLPVPGADLPEVLTLRTVSDVDLIRPLLLPGRRVVAIGAGFIGLEFAAAAVDAGCKVAVLDAAPHPMGRVVDPKVAHSIAATHERRGVTFRLSTAITRIVDYGDHVAVETGSGESFPADLVIVGIGAVPNTELAAEAGLDCQDGVVVDAYGRTSDPDIYAVGDVTRHYNPLLERSLRLESWQNAQNHGIAVARVIAGANDPAPYAELPWFWTDQYDNNFQIIGAPTAWDRVIWRGEPGSAKYTCVYMNGDRVVAGNAMNNPRDIRFLKQLILSGRPVDPGVLADPATNLAQLAKG